MVEQKTVGSKDERLEKEPIPAINVLIVDDEPTLRTLTSAIMDGNVESIIEADSATKAMKQLEANLGINLLLTDLQMPGDNGDKLIKQAKAVFPHLITILATGNHELEAKVKAFKEHDVDFFLPKPFGRDQLLQILDQVKKRLVTKVNNSTN